MDTQQTANRLVELCRLGENMQAIQELYADHIVSKEIPGTPNEVITGKDEVIKKSENWFKEVEEFHSSHISDPVVANNYFSCKMKMDCTFKKEGRMQIEELAVYKVDNGKIVEEQFFYNMPN
ncbi:SnoaL-like domain-containing protein [Aquimarina brevivitae]|uniref:SnoaL-like polyketide cyclase n=1 Tax=Aquimarina brevivitae TaxID=323412 RepID=A0A4Q7NUZ2_9FLAO|nr:SnoaL-like domain-containing protein [Aquimarina brevivitae]RZS90678.1 SnoaL-like polyketide cyclase [Aquimarina brevivitae]